MVFFSCFPPSHFFEEIFERRRKALEKLKLDSLNCCTAQDVCFVASLAMNYLRENTKYELHDVEVFFAESEIAPSAQAFVGTSAVSHLFCSLTHSRIKIALSLEGLVIWQVFRPTNGAAAGQRAKLRVQLGVFLVATHILQILILWWQIA